MSESQSTPAPRPVKPGKPAKPYPDFPLTAHPAGVWCKKIRGKLHYFGSWDDPDGALAKYLSEKDDLHAGRTPGAQPAPGAVSVKDVCNAFLRTRQARVESGELSQRMFLDYREACDLIVDHFPTTTFAPSLTNNRASAAPCPRAPPEISVTFPLSRSISTSYGGAIATTDCGFRDLSFWEPTL